MARPFRSWEGWPSSDGWIRCRLKPGCGSAPEEQPCRLRRQRIAGSGRNICARAPCGSHVPARTTTRRSRSTAMFSACRLSKTSPTASAKTERSSVSLTRTSSWRSFERAAASLRRTRWTCWSCTCPERQRSPRPPNHCVGRVCQRIRRHTRTGLRAEGSCTWTPMAAASSSRRGSTVTSQNPPAHPAGSQGRSAHRLPVMDLWQRLEPCACLPCRPSDTTTWAAAHRSLGLDNPRLGTGLHDELRSSRPPDPYFTGSCRPVAVAERRCVSYMRTAASAPDIAVSAATTQTAVRMP
jgi:hypothetical protein